LQSEKIRGGNEKESLLGSKRAALTKKRLRRPCENCKKADSERETKKKCSAIGRETDREVRTIHPSNFSPICLWFMHYIIHSLAASCLLVD